MYQTIVFLYQCTALLSERVTALRKRELERLMSLLDNAFGNTENITAYNWPQLYNEEMCLSSPPIIHGDFIYKKTVYVFAFYRFEQLIVSFYCSKALIFYF